MKKPDVPSTSNKKVKVTNKALVIKYNPTKYNIKEETTKKMVNISILEILKTNLKTLK